jgi:hypothetical protein
MGLGCARELNNFFGRGGNSGKIKKNPLFFREWV